LRSSKRGLVWLLAVLVAVGLVAGACGSSSSDSSSSSTKAGSKYDYKSLSGTLNGSGATFPKNFYEDAIASFKADASGVTVNYNAVGSGQGKKDLAAGTTDWAGSDSLVKDDSVRVKVISVNVYGDSVESVVGSGAVIQLVPDAPVSLANDPAVTTDTQIRFTWSAGASDGGNAVIDYAVYYDQGTDSFALLDGAVTNQFYLTTVTLTPGTTYKFRVTSRNEVGSSADSEILEVLAAKLPDAPVNLANLPSVTTAYQVGLSWDEGPYNGGSAVIDYEVSFTEVTADSLQIFSSGILTT